jgi:CheY-like chemotaxis protein
VESEPGQGTTFFFSIRAAAGPQKKMVYLQGTQPVLDGKKVLLVDDNRTNRQILEYQLVKWGMQTVSAKSGAEALERLERQAGFDVAILDMHMPEMDGVMLGAKIQKHYSARQLPLIMLTSMGTRCVTKEVSFSAFLYKPVKPLLLHDALLNVLRAPTDERPGRDENQEVQISTELAEQWPLAILLAEDNRVNQMVALKMLARMGYEAEVAENGKEVLARLETEDYDVILMDVQMPEMDGLQTSTQIRQTRPGIRPYIIGMTAHALMEDRTVCLEAGMQDYLAKPVRIEALARALHRAAESSVRTETVQEA